jgi:ABC-type Zn2+ transport system substrate-binding protein/surface adhesin
MTDKLDKIEIRQKKKKRGRYSLLGTGHSTEYTRPGLPLAEYSSGIFIVTHEHEHEHEHDHEHEHEHEH